MTNRYQYVSYNNTNSKILPIKCGVPQVSVLGLVLFLMYIHDLPNITNKSNFTLFSLSLLHRYKYKCNINNLVMLYLSFFHSHINYCSIIWGSTYHSNIKCIQILQNRSMRAIYKLDNTTNIDCIFLRQNILKFKDIIHISIYKYMFRIYKKHYLHSSICKLFTYNCSLYTFRLNKTFLIPKIRFDHEKFSIRYNGAYLWNSLNTTISSLTNHLEYFYKAY